MKSLQPPVVFRKTGVLFSGMYARQPLSPCCLFVARLVVAATLSASPLHAQIASQPVPPPVQFVAQKLNAEELGRLLAPIALYPDALIALILPASTVPADVVLGARYLKSGGDPGQMENQPWDESVKALARYPDVLAWMDENLDWTSSVGEAFVEQPADVMSAVQALREQAKAAGNLADTPQQKVVEDENAIRIVPADPEVIYVPQYDPQVVYVYSTVLTFGPGFFVGPWLCYDFDWNRRCFYRGNWCGWHHENTRNRTLNGNRGGARVVNIDTTNANAWQPSQSALRQINQRQANNNGNARFVSARSSAVGTPQPVVQGNASVRTVQPGIYNPASRAAVPQPSNLARVPGSDVRIHNQPPARSIPEAPVARPARTVTVPSTPPQVPGQINSPGLPRSGTIEPRPSRQPARWTPENPSVTRTQQPASPAATALATQPGRGTPETSRTVVPTVSQPIQAAPEIHRQYQERQQVQPQRQPVQERQQPAQTEQRQLRTETASAPSLQQRVTPAAQPQVQGQPAPVTSKKKPEEKKPE